MENNERLIMSEEERRFKVQKIEKYEEMVEDDKINIAFLIVCITGATFMGLACVVKTMIDLRNSNFLGVTIYGIMAFINSFIATEMSYKLFELFEQKKNDIDRLNTLKGDLDINEELEIQKIKTKKIKTKKINKI